MNEIIKYGLLAWLLIILTAVGSILFRRFVEWIRTPPEPEQGPPPPLPTFTEEQIMRLRIDEITQTFNQALLIAETISDPEAKNGLIARAELNQRLALAHVLGHEVV